MTNECDDYIKQIATDPELADALTPIDFTRKHRADHLELCRRMIDAVLHSRKPDNGASDREPINHDAEMLMARFYQSYLDIYAPRPLRPVDIGVFHLLYAMSRIIVNARQGKVLLDKIVDCGGWAEVTADAARSRLG